MGSHANESSPLPLWSRVWGEARMLLARSRGVGWFDLLFLIGLAGLFVGLLDLGREWSSGAETSVDIELSLWALPRYTFYSLMRGVLAYLLSLGFTLVYGYWAAKDPRAGYVLIPLLDILQSIPVLGFLPGVVLALVALFPSNNVGKELATILMIFTGQAWNMTFSFYHSLRSIPQDLQEVATTYRYSWWQRLKWLELPYSTMGLVWNSMMSMAGGWFFLSICESFKLKDRDFRVPGLGSYASAAMEPPRHAIAMLGAVIAMVLMIIVLDQLLWRPVVAWAQKFRVEEGGASEAVSSWFLDFLRRSALVHAVARWVTKVWPERTPKRATEQPDVMHTATRANSFLAAFPLIVLVGVMAWGGWQLFKLLSEVSGSQWAELIAASGVTLARVLVSTLIGTLWALPAGLAIGLSPRLSRLMQPVVQVVASFPAPMLFPAVIVLLRMLGVSLNWGSILLMLLGTQWYVLFNVVAGGMAIPADLQEAARAYRMPLWQRFWQVYLPAVFPYLVTGWVTAAGGAWNASIVAEYDTTGTETPAWGLGAMISEAASGENFPQLAASVLVMSVIVVLLNRTLWRACYNLAERRFSLNK